MQINRKYRSFTIKVIAAVFALLGIAMIIHWVYDLNWVEISTFFNPYVGLLFLVASPFFYIMALIAERD